jgi:hypothetical protein
VAQGVGPEFKPQYHERQRERERDRERERETERERERNALALTIHLGNNGLPKVKIKNIRQLVNSATVQFKKDRSELDLLWGYVVELTFETPSNLSLSMWKIIISTISGKKGNPLNYSDYGERYIREYCILGMVL